MLRASIRNVRLACAGVLVFTLFLIVHKLPSLLRTYPSQQAAARKLCANLPETQRFPCVTTSLRDSVSFPICLYTAEQDVYVSAAFHSEGYWDVGRVLEIVNELGRHPGAQFVDIGANIGAFSLAVAHVIKRPVVAVEPSTETFARLRQSVCRGNVSHAVTLVNRAVSNERRAVRLATPTGNVGGTIILNDTNCGVDQYDTRCVNLTTHTVTLDDLLPFMTSRAAILKVDVEGSEVKVFDERTAAGFFDEIDVLLVHMEFWFYPAHFAQEENKRRSVERMIAFFHKRGYSAMSPQGNEALGEDWRKWPNDIVWRK